MQAPESIEMSVRGETPFDTVVDRPIAEVNIVKEMLENKSAQVFRLDSKVQPSMYNKPLTLDHRLQAPDQLEMEHLYVNDVVSCDPYKCICEQDMESACMINEKYDFEKMKRAYFMEGCHLTAPPQNQMEGSHMAAQNAAGQRRDVSTVPVEELRPIGALFVSWIPSIVPSLVVLGVRENTSFCVVCRSSPVASVCPILPKTKTEDVAPSKNSNDILSSPNPVVRSKCTSVVWIVVGLCRARHRFLVSLTSTVLPAVAIGNALLDVAKPSEN